MEGRDLTQADAAGVLDQIMSGDFEGDTFQFTVHSPAISGIEAEQAAEDLFDVGAERWAEPVDRARGPGHPRVQAVEESRRGNSRRP